MLQQRLARSLQLLVRQPQPLRSSTLLTAPCTPATLRLAPAASQQLSSRRWYSSAEQSEKKEEDTTKGSPDAQGSKDTPKADAGKEDPVQKELEAKKKEVIDVTVRMIY